MVESNGPVNRSDNPDESVFWEGENRATLRFRLKLESFGSVLRTPWIVAACIFAAVGAFVGAAILPVAHHGTNSGLRTPLAPGKETLVGTGLFFAAILVFGLRTSIRSAFRGVGLGITVLSLVLFLLGLGTVAGGLVKLV